MAQEALGLGGVSPIGHIGGEENATNILNYLEGQICVEADDYSFRLCRIIRDLNAIRSEFILRGFCAGYVHLQSWMVYLQILRCYTP